MAARAVALEPTSETAFRAALRSLSLAGDRSGALDLCDRFHARLAELGLTPGEESRALIERVRRQREVRRDVTLDGVDDLFVRPPLGGRAGELGRLLEEAARAARSRRPVLVLLEGESGVGKTRLLEEMLARLRLDGASVATARAVEGDRGDPWSGVLALARGGLIDAAGVGGAPTAALAALRGPAAGMGGPVSGRARAGGRAARRGRWWRRCARPRRSSPSCSRWTTPSGWTRIPRSRSARCCGICATSR